MARDGGPSPPLSWHPAAVAVAAAVVPLALGGWLLARRGAALGFGRGELSARLAQGLLAIETVAFALLAPYLAARASGQGRWTRRAVWVGAPLLALAGAAVLVCVVATRGGAELGAVVWAQLFLLSFAAVLAAAVGCARRLGCRASTAQLAATCVALAMVGSVLYLNGVLALLPAPEASPARLRAARLAYWASPFIIIGGTLLREDPIRNERLYQWCIIGDYPYPIDYPASGLRGTARRGLAVSAAYLGVAFLLWVLPRLALLRRRRAARAAGG